MVREIDARTLNDLLKSGEVILIDVRERDEYITGHIDQSISIPLSVFPQKFCREDYPLDQVIVLQCQAGVRSMRACSIVDESAEQGHVINLAGGLNAWKSEGFPVVK